MNYNVNGVALIVFGLIITFAGGIFVYEATLGKTLKRSSERTLTAHSVVLIGIFVLIVGVNVNGPAVKDYKSVIKTSHELFSGIESSASATQNNTIAGQITLKDQNTAAITPSAPALSTEVNSSLPPKPLFLIPLTSTSSDMRLSGNLSQDNKKWCFYIFTPNYQIIYTQSGKALDGYGTTIGYCLNGLAYDASDTLLSHN